MKNIISVCLSLLFGICTYCQSKISFVSDIEKANKAAKLHKKEALSFDIELAFAGKTALKGTVISSTNSSYIKIVKADSTVLTFDGNKV